MKFRSLWWLLAAMVAVGCFGAMGWSIVSADWLEALTLSNTFPLIIAMGSGVFLILAVLLYREFGKRADPVAHVHETADHLKFGLFHGMPEAAGAVGADAPGGMAALSHTLRTPADAVLGLSELLLAEPLEEKHLAHARDIRDAARALVMAVNAMGNGGSLATEPEMRAHPVTGPVRVLVVDDNAVNLTVAQDLLRFENIPCHTATSGEEALAKISAHEYALIFLDHVMPGLTGVETARRIRSLAGEKSRTPIIALTANVQAEDRVRYIQAGMDDVLPKPIERDRLRAILDKWLLCDTSDGETPTADFQ
ncbi:MAG: response regulator [Planctomycetaceae bacterium]|nr:response regulator [Planctomycetaceae bacterium]